MKKNIVYIQTSILYEVMKVYTSRDIADRVLTILDGKNVELSVYSTHEDAITFRKKRDCVVTDDSIIRAFTKSIKHMIKDKIGTKDDIVEVINDNYEFEYDDKYINDAFFASILEIHRSGRLISIEIDVR